MRLNDADLMLEERAFGDPAGPGQTFRRNGQTIEAESNFGDESDYWIPFRALDREAIDAAGRTFDTLIVRVRFPNGVQRDYWLASEPPYKVRLVVYERGSLIRSGWELESLQAQD
jgi:hypothetical protein